MKRFAQITIIIGLISSLYAQPNEFFAPVSQKEKGGKSVLLAVGLSLLVPGAGELYLGESKTATGFITAEGIIWLSALIFYTRGNWIKENYKSYAVNHAGINPYGKDDDFFKNIGFYMTREQYNFEKLLFTEDRTLLYPETPEYNWSWDNEESMHFYHKLWTDSKTAYRNAIIALGVAGANRILSIIDVLRIKYITGEPKGFTIRLTPQDYESGHIGVTLSLKVNF